MIARWMISLASERERQMTTAAVPDPAASEDDRQMMSVGSEARRQRRLRWVPTTVFIRAAGGFDTASKSGPTLAQMVAQNRYFVGKNFAADRRVQVTPTVRLVRAKPGAAQAATNQLWTNRVFKIGTL
jgi:hypothetical protein